MKSECESPHAASNVLNGTVECRLAASSVSAWGLAFSLFLLSLTALVHGLFPFIFTSTVSDKIHEMNHDLS